MFPPKFFLSLVLVAFSVADATHFSRDTGKATLLITRINGPGLGSGVVEKDSARAQVFLQAGSPPSVSIQNTAVTYVAEVGVGEPHTNFTLLIDTGSSNTWVGANKTYVPTNSSHDTGHHVLVGYGSGIVYGEEWIDTVALSPELVIYNQSIGVASVANGFDGFDDILGVGSTDLTVGTVVNTTTVPTVTDSLYAQGKINEEVLGVYFAPASTNNSDGGLTFGGYDSSVITRTVPPASRFWGVNQSISYGNETILSLTVGVVDTGTTMILIATDAFQKYQNSTGGTLDENTGLLTLTAEQYDRLKPLDFHIGEETYTLTPNAQIWPRSLNARIGGERDKIYLVVNDIGHKSGQGLDFVNGYTFLERYYSVFDTTNNRLGLAHTQHTYSESN